MRASNSSRRRFHSSPAAAKAATASRLTPKMRMGPPGLGFTLI